MNNRSGPVRPARIYIVEDDPSVRRGADRLFRALGYLVEGFASAEDFLSRPRETDGACLILDLELPGMDGLALQELLAGQGCRLPVVVVTAHTDGRRVRALAAGAVAWLEKPVEPAALEATVVRALEGRSPGDNRD